MTIFRYPYKAPVEKGSAGGGDDDAPTEAIDYLAIRRSRINFKDGDVNYYGENLPNNAVKRTYNEDAVYLAIPPQLQTAYQPSYRRADMGVAGVMAASMMGSGMGGDQSNLNNIANAVISAAQGGLPEFAASTISQAANGINNLLGLAGGADAQSLMQLSKGKVFNPFAEQIFSTMAFRTHVFNFKFLSRNEAEANQIWNIINYIKKGSAPIVAAGDTDIKIGKKGLSGKFEDTISNTADQRGANLNLLKDFQEKGSSHSKNFRFLEVPDKFHLKMMRLSADGSLTEGSREHGLHFRMHTSVCTGVNVNYTPDGQYTSFKRLDSKQVHVPAIQMSVSFTETRMVTQRDIEGGY